MGFLIAFASWPVKGHWWRPHHAGTLHPDPIPLDFHSLRRGVEMLLTLVIQGTTD